MRLVLFVLLSQTAVLAQDTVLHQNNVLAPQTAVPAPPIQPAAPAATDAPQISVELRFISVPAGHSDTLQIPGRPKTAVARHQAELPNVALDDLKQNNGIQLVSARKITTQQQPIVAQQLSESQMEQFVRRAQGDQRSNVLFAPKVIVFDGQVAEIADGVERPFVTQSVDGSHGSQGVIEFVKEGTMVQVRTVSLPEGIKMDIAVDLTQITDVEEKAVLKGTANIQLPEVAASQVALSALVKRGETLLISGLQKTTEHRIERRKLGLFKDVGMARRTEDILILVTPRIVDPDTVASVR